MSKKEEEFKEDPWRNIFADTFNRRWLSQRKNILSENMQTTNNEKVDKELERQLQNLSTLQELHRVDNSDWDLPTQPTTYKTKIADMYKKKDNVIGFYIPALHTAVYEENDPIAIVHERTHATDPKPQIKAIEKKLNGNIKRRFQKDDYLDDPNEIYSRLMSLRHKYGLDPKKQYTREEIEKLSKMAIKDPDVKHLFDRYTMEFMMYLINDVAQNSLKQINDTPIAKFGGKIFGKLKKI